jgi:hypothetical protein
MAHVCILLRKCCAHGGSAAVRFAWMGDEGDEGEEDEGDGDHSSPFDQRESLL